MKLIAILNSNSSQCARLRIDMRSFYRFLVIIGLKKLHRNTTRHCVLFLFTFYSLQAILVWYLIVVLAAELGNEKSITLL